MMKNVYSDLDIFQTAIGGFPGGSITTTIQHTNTHVTYTQIQISHKITPLKTNKQNKEKQISSQGYTNSEGHITANEYCLEIGKEMKISLIQPWRPTEL
jgi:hypothetical protein